MSSNEREAVKQKISKLVARHNVYIVEDPEYMLNHDALVNELEKVVDQAIAEKEKEFARDAKLVIDRLDQVFGIRDHQINKWLAKYQPPTNGKEQE
jgi:hypothetical protein